MISTTPETAAPRRGKKRERNANARLGARIKSLRMASGMSQGALGERLGVTFQQVQKYENGANGVSAEKLHKIAAVFGVATDYFFDVATAQDGAASIEALCTDHISFRLAHAFTSIPEHGTKLAIVHLVERIARTPATEGA